MKYVAGPPNYGFTVPSFQERKMPERNPSVLTDEVGEEPYTERYVWFRGRSADLLRVSLLPDYSPPVYAGALS